MSSKVQNVYWTSYVYWASYGFPIASPGRSKLLQHGLSSLSLRLWKQLDVLFCFSSKGILSTFFLCHALLSTVQGFTKTFWLRIRNFSPILISLLMFSECLPLLELVTESFDYFLWWRSLIRKKGLWILIFISHKKDFNGLVIKNITWELTWLGMWGFSISGLKGSTQPPREGGIVSSVREPAVFSAWKSKYELLGLLNS